MKKYIFLIVFIFLFSASFSVAKAYDIYVDKSNSGSEDGSESNPYNTIDEAIDEAMDNDSGSRSIYVKDGEYDESIELGDSVKIYGQSKGGTIIKGSSHTTVTMKSGSSIQNVSIVGGGTGIFAQSSASISNCWIRDFSKIGISASSSSAKISIKNSKIYNGSGKGIYIQKGRKVDISGNEINSNDEEGIDIRQKTSGTISKNNILNNGESGIELIVGSSKLKISGNTIKGNKAAGITNQYYKEASKKGNIKISSNKISSSKNKFGITVATPSGGDDKKSGYWSKSIKVKNNKIKKGKGIKKSITEKD